MILRITLLVSAMAAILVGGPVQAQSFVAGSWPGYPVESADAASRALGGIGMGGPGISTVLSNPAELALLPGSVFQGTMVGERTRTDVDSFSTVRFPQIHVGFRLAQRWAVGVGFDGAFGHGWSVEREDTVRLEADTVAVLDRYSESGGSSVFRVAVGYSVTDALSVGIGGALLSGTMNRQVTRTFLEQPMSPVGIQEEGSVSGVGGMLGVRWSPTPAFALAGAVETGGRLTVRSGAIGSPTEGEPLDLPPSVEVGVSGRVGGELFARAGGRWSGWSSVDERLAGHGGARDHVSLGGGLEYRPREQRLRAIPVRVGYRWSQLPFHRADLGGAAFPDEHVASLGVGARIAAGALRPDLTLERGWRSGNGADTDESFWRAIFSLTVISQ